MIGLDTNVLLRYLTRDDPFQSKAAATFLEQELTAEQPGYINVVTFAELVWTLRTTYKATDEHLLNAVMHLLQAETLIVQSAAEVGAALVDVKEGRGSFADALIARLNVAAGCDRTVTFDRRALRLEGFAALPT